MGLDIGSLFGNSSTTGSQGMSDVLAQGANAGVGYLENQVIGVLQADKQQHEEAYAVTTQNQLNTPSQPGTFTNYISGLTKSAALQNYGPWIFVGVAIVAVSGYFLLKGK